MLQVLIDPLERPTPCLTQWNQGEGETLASSVLSQHFPTPCWIGTSYPPQPTPRRKGGLSLPMVQLTHHPLTDTTPHTSATWSSPLYLYPFHLA